MKRFYTIASASAILAVALVACGKKKEVAATGEPLNLTTEIQQTAETLKGDTVYASTLAYGDVKLPATTLVRNFTTASPEIYLSAEATVLDEFPATSEYVCRKLTSLYTDATGRELPQPDKGIDSAASLTQAIDNIGADFKTEVAPEYAQITLTPGFNISAAYTVDYATPAFVTYQIFNSTYTGGAHGMSDFYYETIDPATGNALGFDQLIKAGKQADFRRLVVETIAKSQNVSVEEYLRKVNEFLMSTPGNELTAENFPIYHVGVTADGLAVVYPAYSIAPYSDGTPSYLIPTDTAAGYLAL